MPVIPSFSAFASTPDTAGAYLAGAKQTQDAIHQAQAIQLEKQKIAQQGQMAQMELRAKQVQLERDSMRKDQELAIESQYKEIQLGLRQRELDQAEKVNQVKIQEAAREFQAQQMYQRRFKELGGTEEAARKAMFEIGPAGGSSAFSAAMRSEGAAAPIPGLGEVTTVPGREDLQRFQNGPHSFQIVPKVPSSVSGDEPLVPIEGSNGGLGRIGNKVVRIPENPELKMAASELKGLIAAQAKQQSDYDYISSKKGKLSETQQALKDSFEKRERQIEELRKKLGQSTFTGTAEAPATSSTNRIGRFSIITE